MIVKELSGLQVCNLKGSSELCEDFFVINHDHKIYGVIDGATSVSSYKNEHGETGGFLAAQLLAKHFKKASASRSLTDIVMEANNELRNMMLDAGVDVSCKADLWCAAFAVCRIHETSIEYVQAGDCMLFAKYNDGERRKLTRDQVAPFDAISIREREKAMNHGYKDKKDIFRYVLPVIRSNRQKTNTLEGYSVMNGEPELARFLEYGTFNRAGLMKVYAVTDGLFYPNRDIGAEVDWEKMLATIDKNGLDRYANDLNEIEQKDDQCLKYPRHKVSDDKTGIVIDF